MDADTIHKIQTLALAATRIEEIEGKSFLVRTSGVEQIVVDRHLVFPTMKVNSLSGFAQYLLSQLDSLASHPLGIVHVRNHRTVAFVAAAADEHRDVIALAEYSEDVQAFGTRLSLEEALVWLRSRFAPQDDVADLIRSLGNVADGMVKTAVDDGFSQTVTIKAGATILGVAEKLKPIVRLAPYRTFREIPQPSGEFLVRVHSNTPDTRALPYSCKELPQVSIHEADGGEWKLTAMKAIAEHLSRLLPTFRIIT